MNDGFVQLVDWSSGSAPTPSVGPRAAAAESGERFATMPAWGQRYFESAETNRLNQAHWARADDQSINTWLAAQLPVIRARARYETRQNGIVQGIQNTFADDVVGRDGPTLQVLSDDPAYNAAAEATWREWFAAPTPRPNVSGVALLKLWVRNLWRCGEFLATIVTDRAAETPVQLRLQPTHPRRLVSPADRGTDPNTTMGIEFDALNRPRRYWIADATASGTDLAYRAVKPYPPDLVIHEFILDEEGQARGIPWLNPGLQPAADLRDYDDQVQDAARQIADQCALLYTDHPEAKLWTLPEETSIQRRTQRMAPPGWKPFVYPAAQPPVQYPDYRAERLRELGRPVGMPLLMIRLDASRHNYSSARLDTQCYRQAIGGVQTWLSGSERSVGVLNRCVELVLAEARFSNPALRRRPARVFYRWIWPSMPHVDVEKERNGQRIGLENGTLLFSDAVAQENRDLESHVAALERERQLLAETGLGGLPWISGGRTQPTPPTPEEMLAEAQAAAQVSQEDAVP